MQPTLAASETTQLSLRRHQRRDFTDFIYVELCRFVAVEQRMLRVTESDLCFERRGCVIFVVEVFGRLAVVLRGPLVVIRSIGMSLPRVDLRRHCACSLKRYGWANQDCLRIVPSRFAMMRHVISSGFIAAVGGFERVPVREPCLMGGMSIVFSDIEVP